MCDPNRCNQLSDSAFSLQASWDSVAYTFTSCHICQFYHYRLPALLHSQILPIIAFLYPLDRFHRLHYCFTYLSCSSDFRPLNELRGLMFYLCPFLNIRPSKNASHGSAPEQIMFRNGTKVTLFWPGTLPVPVPVLTLLVKWLPNSENFACQNNPQRMSRKICWIISNTSADRHVLLKFSTLMYCGSQRLWNWQNPLLVKSKMTDGVQIWNYNVFSIFGLFGSKISQQN